MGDNPLGLELTEAAEGDRAALLQRSIPGWAGARIAYYSFCSVRVICERRTAERGLWFLCDRHLRRAGRPLSLGGGRGRYGCESRCVYRVHLLNLV